MFSYLVFSTKGLLTKLFYLIMKRFALLAVLLLISIAAVASATMDAPQWKAGLYWKYEVKTFSPSATYTMTVKIESKEIFVEGNKSYTVWKISYKNEEGPAAGDGYTYLRTSDFKVVKEVINTPDGKQVESIYSPPFPLMRYGVDPGFQWENVTMMTVKDEKGNVINNVPMRIRGMCIAKENVTVPLGEYKCYEVSVKKIYQFPDGDRHEKMIFYYAPSVGNWVKMEKYVEDEKVSELSLIKTNYGSKKIPLPSYIMLLAFAIAILMKIIYKAMRFTDNENSS